MSDTASLHVCYDGTDGEIHRVRWLMLRSGSKSYNGTLLFSGIPPGLQDPEVILELLAVKQIIFLNPTCLPSHFIDNEGKGLSLVFSRGAAKKVLLRKTTKKWLVKHGVPIQTRLRYANLKVAKKFPLPPVDQPIKTEKIRPPAEFNWAAYGFHVDVLKFPNIGEVQVCRHAVDRMEESLPEDAQVGPWMALLHQVRTDPPTPCELPRGQRTRKAIRYGNRDTLQLYRSGDYILHLVNDEADRTDVPKLVTLYNDKWRRDSLDTPERKRA